MKKNIGFSIVRDQSGQALVLVAVMMVVLLGAAALVIDIGDLFIDYNRLQGSTNAAALAGAHSLPQTSATSVAQQYSGGSGDLNYIPGLPNVTMVAGYPKLLCLSSLQKQSIPCQAPSNANAIQVKQQVSVPLVFAGLIGFHSYTLTATATAAMRGGLTPSYNVAIVLDTTASMNDIDASSDCSDTRLNCALAGIQSLMQTLSPCAYGQSSCGAIDHGNVANSVDRVSLFVFPNLKQDTIKNDYGCNGIPPTTQPYTFPTATSASYSPSGASYQVVSYSSDYRTSTTSTSLNGNSNLTKSSGGASACQPLSAPGGQGTYVAGAIYAAQASLVAEKAANPGSQNVMILLSDGDSSASSSAMAGASTTSGTYPSTKQQCHQAIQAASAATAAGTTIYSIAYGAGSSGCSTDTSPSINPCQTMEGIASNATTFFSDYTATGGSSACISASRPTTKLSDIFKAVAVDFSVPRLIPNNAT